MTGIGTGRPPKAPLWARFWWLGERIYCRIRAAVQLRNLGSGTITPIRDSRVADDVVVSLTTYGKRFDTVHLTIASIMQGSLQPRRLLLWVDDPALIDAPTPELRVMMDQGLEMKLCEDLGPHKKYYLALAELAGDHHTALVTADDDVLYPRRWLEGLHRAWRSRPNTVHAYRCHRIRFRGAGVLAPYSTWTPAFGTKPRSDIFLTGVSGVLYPPAALDALRRAGRGFLTAAPRADDVWLNRVVRDANLQVRQVTPVPQHFPTVPGTQDTSLVATNVGDAGNDQQLARTFSLDLIHRLYQQRQV